jgi:ElaB/YqjD/DUF883 family membrane-anchored ribosome-binding protein
VAFLALLSFALFVVAPSAANTPAQFPQTGLDKLARMNNLLGKAADQLKPGQPDPNRGDVKVLIDLAKKVERHKHDLVDKQFVFQKVLCIPVDSAFFALEKADLGLDRGVNGTAGQALGGLVEARSKLRNLSSAIALAPDRDPACDRARNEAAEADIVKLLKRFPKVIDKVEAVIKKLGEKARMRHAGARKDIRELVSEKQKLIGEHMREETYCVRFDALYSNLYLIDQLLIEAREELGDKHPDFDKVYKRFKGARSIKDFIELQFKEQCPPGGTEACSSTLERSSGTPPYTAVNHIRVLAICSQAITKVVVTAISMETFDACAQTEGSGTGCTASGQIVTTTWNQPANIELEFFARVTGDAAGMYHVTIHGAGDVILKEYDATVP